MKKWFKVWVPIVDEDGEVVDHYRHDWTKFKDDVEAQGAAFEAAQDETWGENNEYRPSVSGIEVECEA